MRFGRFAPLFALGIYLALLLAGIALGEVRVVWQKAVTICLSCIGIG